MRLLDEICLGFSGQNKSRTVICLELDFVQPLVLALGYSRYIHDLSGNSTSEAEPELTTSLHRHVKPDSDRTMITASFGEFCCRSTHVRLNHSAETQQQNLNGIRPCFLIVLFKYMILNLDSLEKNGFLKSPLYHVFLIYLLM